MRLKKGFTLLEILLVIALIGILASIVIVAINPTRQLAQARNFQRQGHIKTINDAISQYIVKTGDTPEGLTGWYKDICPVGGGSNCVDLSVLIPDYLSEIPTEPDGTPYQIALDSSTNKLSIKSGAAELGADISTNPLAPVSTFVKQLVNEGFYDVRSTKHLADGTFIVYGGYWDTLTLGEGEANEITLPNEGDLDMFIAKYNSDGTLAWAKRAGGLGQESINHVAVGVDGSVVIGGRFGNNPITFRPGEVNPIVLTGTGSSDIFLAKYDTNGNLLWAESVAGSPGFFNEYVGSIEIISDGSTIVVGDFEGTTTFGVGESNQTVLTSAGNTEAFVAKYNTNGTLAWAKRAGGSQYDSSRDMIVNQDGSIIVTGVMSANATFGPGEPGAVPLTSAGSWDIYIAKYAANGNLVWAKRAGGLGSGDSPYYIEKSANGSFMVTGIIDETATFGPGELNQTILPVSSLVIANTFIAKYNADGTLVWTKQGASSHPTDYSSNQVKGLSVADNGNITIAGEFSYNVTFAEGESNEVTLTSTGDRNLYITQYNPNGELIWAKRAGSIGYDTIYGFNSFSDGSIVITGLFGENMVFGPGEPNSVSMSSLVGDTYIAKYNTDGSVDWAKRILNTESFSVSSSLDGSSVLVGEMFGNTIFGIDDINQIPLNLIGSYDDMFIAKFNADGLLE